MAKHPLVGKPAPSLSLFNNKGETYNFTPGTQGAPVALFFFPKAGTYGCTREVCQFRDALVDQDTFKRSNIIIVGVSPDSVDTLKDFAAKQKVTYPILSDPNGEARNVYSVGKGLFGLSEARVTYFIDQNGIVRNALDATLNFGAHVKFVQDCIEELEAAVDVPQKENPEPIAATAA
ncbi:atypical 2-cysteine peroxiredoxin [Heterobasidion irregulare TC 32-1]|uniref:thioredoxin-dependent peroxiredoxin n=1 Tax=Heterobasidion irregulare (strain TC 32-1) TaxID=747525 RepID=W4K7G1_HETIT|nr:atypical 2-cysteine peroxiredoxin [Heterobasidion irregulare TC 32-1]ETW81767.1 atypical 2-cysteine peroxiredoxin [Heterobasidion irregulare TC 32-1]